MTDENTITKVEAFNPYDASAGDGYYANRAWDYGKAAAQRDAETDADVDDTPNPYVDADPDKARHQAWHEGYVGTGYGASAFDYPVPTEENGIFVMPDLISMDDKRTLTSKYLPAMVWCYDAQSDKQDPKVRPNWSNFPTRARAIQIAEGHAWTAGIRWMTDAGIRGTKHYELPCPPYNFEVEGARLTISAGFFSKSGSKKEWEQVLEGMQEEVDNMPDGFYIGDDYVNMTLTARVSGSISVSASALLSGHEDMDEDEWTGTPDEYEQAVSDATDDYDFSYDVSDMEIDMDYADWEVEDIDTSELSSG